MKNQISWAGWFLNYLFGDKRTVLHREWTDDGELIKEYIENGIVLLI
jgi:hypothetical protein